MAARRQERRQNVRIHTRAQRISRFDRREEHTFEEQRGDRTDTFETLAEGRPGLARAAYDAPLAVEPVYARDGGRSAPLRALSTAEIAFPAARLEVRRSDADEHHLLAEAGESLLAAGLDLDLLVSSLARIVVRDLADWFVLDTIDGGVVRRVEVACSDPGKRRLAMTLENMVVDRASPHLMSEALDRRRAKLVSDVEPGYLSSIAQSPDHLALLCALDLRSSMVVPLVAHGRLLGAVAFLSSREGRRFRERDLRLAEDLARITALAVDNARRHRTTQRAIAARDEILGIVAHDLRTPLNAVLMQAECLRAAEWQTARQRRTAADNISRAALRMSRLVQDMLDVARLDSGPLTIEPKAVVTRGLLEEAVETHRHGASKRDLTLRLDAEEPLPDLHADHDRLLQVFDNVIGNAVKFTQRGGEIVVGARPGAGEVLFWVADTGAGVPAEQLAHMFDRFWQGAKQDRRGAGLGLAIVRGIIDSHGGRAWAESTAGRGTTLYFTVKVAALAR